MILMIDYIKEHKKTFFLKMALVLMFIPIVLITCFATSSLYLEAVENNEINHYFVLPFVILMILVLLPCAVAIFQTLKLFANIEKGVYYSEKSMQSFRIIQYSGIVSAGLFVAMLPSVFYFAEMDDAPGLALSGLVFVFGGCTIAVFASVMRDLVMEKVLEK